MMEFGGSGGTAWLLNAGSDLAAPLESLDPSTYILANAQLGQIQVDSIYLPHGFLFTQTNAE
jgi:hypothetical protein